MNIVNTMNKESNNYSDTRTVSFVGAGPGNPKLITVAGMELLQNADVIIYAGSLVNPKLLEDLTCEKIDSYGMNLDELTDAIDSRISVGKNVVRLHSGDPSLYGAIIEQMDRLAERGIEVDIVPGVSSIFATAAALKTQLTLNGVSDTLIITRPEGKTLDKDIIKELSAHGATMAVFLGTPKIREVLEKVEYPKDTPAALVYHASWEDEKVIRGTVGTLADLVEEAEITRSAMILIGGVVNPTDFRRSHLYGSQ